MKTKRAKNGQDAKESNNEKEVKRKKNKIKIKFTIIEPKP
jgi:hypothetical protein